MTQADVIRAYAVRHYVVPARTQGLTEIIIRAGDIHQGMGLANAMPAVCSAIGGIKFCEVARVVQLARKGPANGSNVYFTFSLRADLDGHSSPTNSVGPRPVRETDCLELTDCVVLISCVKSKRPYSSPARLLYTSAWFTKARDLVEAAGARWFVLSSLYGLVAPEEQIEPYDYTLNTLGVAERRAWAKKVLEKLLPALTGERRVVMLAGQRYREFLIEPLEAQGIRVDVPMAHLKRGEQLAWLSEAE